MEISAIMNIHELTVNRTVKQRADARVKKGQKEVQDNALQSAKLDGQDKGLIGAMANAVQKADPKEEPQSETPVTGNVVDIRT